MLGFVTRMHHWPSQVRIVYGDPREKPHLSEALRDRYAATEKPLYLVIPD
ncbi:MAG: hypothetical protein ACLGID_14005 [Gammaproteobacteria bacterium]